MPKNISSMIDKKERERTIKLAEAFDSGEEITLVEIFDSQVIPEILEEKPLSFIVSFGEENVPLLLNCLLFSRVLITICPKCSCNANPELIKPYLEREMILPILTHPLSHYRTDFADLAIQYPFIGAYSYILLKNIQPFTSENGKRGVLCAHCFGEYRERILKKLSEVNGDRKKITSIRKYLGEHVIPLLDPAYEQELQILKEIEDAVNKKNLRLLAPLGNKADILYRLRKSQIFDAVPEVSQKDLSNINNILSKMDLSLDLRVTEQIEDKKLAIKALNIDYNPKMPVEDYLDIILPRRKKINNLLNGLISERKDQQFSKINDEIWKINEEICSSKAIESLSFLTSLVSDNAKILFGMLIGGLIGYSSASFAGCGLGSGIGGLTSGIVGKTVSKHISFKTPKYPKRTVEWIKERIESPTERFLSIMLSRDIKLIQTWDLRRKIERT